MSETEKSSFAVLVEQSGRAATVRCRGRLIYGLTNELLVPVKQLIPTCDSIVLECTELVRLDSTGLGTLVRLYVSAKSAGCSLRMKNVGPQVRQLLGVTNLLDALTTIGEHNIKLG
jgi:anti-anti-sigma factor